MHFALWQNAFFVLEERFKAKGYYGIICVILKMCILFLLIFQLPYWFQQGFLFILILWLSNVIDSWSFK